MDRALDDGEPPCELVWEGGAFAPGETPGDHPWAQTVRGALRDEVGAAPLAGVPWGADMRLFTARGIPAVMVGTTGIERAHAVDEYVSLDRAGERRENDHPRGAALRDSHVGFAVTEAAVLASGSVLGSQTVT